VSLGLEILQVSAQAPRLLGESADLVRQFAYRQQNPDGGFRDRQGHSDIYYTVFGLGLLLALGESLDLDRLQRYLTGFGAGEKLDFVHLTCLARCWSLVPSDTCPRDVLLRRLAGYRSADGGFNQLAGAPTGTVYASYLAWAAYQDLQEPVPEPARIAGSLDALRSKDGAFANERNLPVGSTTATAGVVSLYRHLGVPLPARVGGWLLGRAHPDGGFLATPRAPLPDLLSTATALHALAGLAVDFSPLREALLDFIDTLWSAEGGFHGHWADDFLDVEYTSYGLLALGHLAMLPGD
jgi:prenyltransferase beta subunit